MKIQCRSGGCAGYKTTNSPDQITGDQEGSSHLYTVIQLLLHHLLMRKVDLDKVREHREP